MSIKGVDIDLDAFQVLAIRVLLTHLGMVSTDHILLHAHCGLLHVLLHACCSFRGVSRLYLTYLGSGSQLGTEFLVESARGQRF